MVTLGKNDARQINCQIMLASMSRILLLWKSLQVETAMQINTNQNNSNKLALTKMVAIRIGERRFCARHWHGNRAFM